MAGVYIGCEAGYLYCINAYTGDLIWNYYTTDPDMKDASPAIYQDRVYFTQPSMNFITCLNATTGSLIWEQPVGGRPAKSLTITNDKIYFGANTDKIYCWEATTGTTIWEYTTGGDVHSIPAIHNNQLYIGSVDGHLYCLNANTGDLIWSYDTGNVVNSAPAVAHGYVYVGSWSNSIYCLTEDTGTLVWSYLTDDHISSSPAIAYDKIYVTSWTSLYCLDAYSGDFKWSYTPNMGFYASPAVADGKIYIGDIDYYFFCFDAETGNILWQKNLGWYLIISSPAVADRMIIVGHSNNLVYCFRDMNNPPDIPSTPDGPDNGITGVEYTFTTSADDPELDEVYYMFDWGDGTFSEWIGPFPSGTTGEGSHAWDTEGDYEVKAKAKDINDRESDWSSAHTITIGTGPILEIGAISGGLLKIKAVIRNIGDADAIDVHWSITLEGGFILVGRNTSGENLDIPAGGEETVSSSIILGFGPTTIIVKAWIPDVTSDTVEIDVFLFLIFIYIKPGGGI